jgi:hypothetical protein
VKTINIISQANDTLASHRMRVMIPNEALNLHGDYKSKVSDRADANCQVNIFHKHVEQQRNVSEALHLGDVTHIMFDICDDHFDKPYSAYYKTMCSLAHTITCNTANMQARIYEVTGRLAQICSDPITFPFHEPVYSYKPQTLWFGHALNVFSIVPYIGKIPDLTIITNTKIPSTDKVQTKYWKPNLVEDTIPMYDIVVIPLISTPEARLKSANRAVDALHSGRFVIAESEEVYGELHDFIFLGSIEEGLEFYKKYPERVIDMIKKGQEYVLEKYNHKAICEQWVNAIEYEDLSRYDN